MPNIYARPQRTLSGDRNHTTIAKARTVLDGMIRLRARRPVEKQASPSGRHLDEAIAALREYLDLARSRTSR